MQNKNKKFAIIVIIQIRTLKTSLQRKSKLKICTNALTKEKKTCIITVFAGVAELADA